jgi:exodeoxyribonuclease VII large subunit
VEEINYIKLSELSRKIENVFKQNFSNDFYWIIAEISGHKFYPDTDRHYFDLVEKTVGSEVEVAKFKAKSWSEGSANIANFEQQTGQQFQSGIQVLIRVKVEYHSLYGLSLTLVDIDPTFTLGNIEKQRRATLLKLVQDNPGFIKFIDEEYITRNKELTLPLVIQRIALIASPNSEGYTDFIHTIRNNQHAYKFEVDNYFSTVQGRDAEKELINTLINIHQSEKEYDCVVLIRGGGAKTDFLVFDTYHLSRAVAKFPIPIITGIGHHKDVSIVDLMAHSSTKTPTKCAEFIISNNKHFDDALLDLQHTVLIKTQQLLSIVKADIQETNANIIANVQRLVNGHAEELNSLNNSIISYSKELISNLNQELISDTIMFINKPQLLINQHTQHIEHLSQNVLRQSHKFIVGKNSEMNHYVKVMKLMSPVNILKKGFAIISQGDKVLANTSAIDKKEPLQINMYKAEIEVEIKKVTETDGKKYDI